MSEREGTKDIEELFRDGEAIDRALREAVKDAFREHKKLGHPIVVWEDGKVVVVPPDKICIEDEPDTAD